jgi:hypothetical protein
MRAYGGREERQGENCRRADIPELALARLECGSLLPLLRGMDSRPSDRQGGGAAIAKAASRRTPPTCKSSANCRRADNSKNWKFVLGVPR